MSDTGLFNTNILHLASGIFLLYSVKFKLRNGLPSGAYRINAYTLTKMTASEEEILKGLRAGNEIVLKKIYKDYYGPVSHFICRNNGTQEDAMEIYQQAVITFYQKVRSEQFQLSCKIGTFIYSICRKMWLKNLERKKRYFGKIEEHEEFLPVEQESENFEEHEQHYQRMSDALLQLGEPCQTLITDFYYKEMNMDEITEKFGYTNSDNAKNQKYKCLQRLKRIFFQQH